MRSGGLLQFYGRCSSRLLITEFVPGVLIRFLSDAISPRFYSQNRLVPEPSTALPPEIQSTDFSRL